MESALDHKKRGLVYKKRHKNSCHILPPKKKSFTKYQISKPPKLIGQKTKTQIFFQETPTHKPS